MLQVKGSSEEETLEQAIFPEQKSEFVSILPEAREERNQNLENSLDAGTLPVEGSSEEKKPKEVQYGFKQQAKKYSTGESLTAFRGEDFAARPAQVMRDMMMVPQRQEFMHEARQFKEFMPEAKEYSLRPGEIKITEAIKPLKEKEFMQKKYITSDED
jgi:hypothetical protein